MSASIRLAALALLTVVFALSAAATAQDGEPEGSVTFNIDLYIAAAPVDGEDFATTPYALRDTLVVPLDAFGETGIVPLDPKFEGAEGLRQRLESSVAGVNQSYNDASIEFKIRNVFVISAKQTDISPFFDAEDRSFKFGWTGKDKDRRSGLLPGFRKATDDNKDAFRIFVCEIFEDENERGLSVTPGSTGIVSLFDAVDPLDNGRILSHELGHMFGLEDKETGNAFTSVMVHQQPNRGIAADERRVARPRLDQKDIETIRARISQGTYDKLRADKSKTAEEDGDGDADRQGQRDEPRRSPSLGQLPPETSPDVRIAISDPQSPMPRDRARFSYNYFAGALDFREVGKLGITNAGLGERHDVTMLGASGAVSFAAPVGLPGQPLPAIERIDLFMLGATGASDSGTGPITLDNSVVLLQPAAPANGTNTQVLPAGLQLSNVETSTEVGQFSAGARTYWREPFTHTGIFGQALFEHLYTDVSFSHIERDEKLEIRADQLNFFSLDKRRTDVDRFSFGLGAEFAMPLSPQFRLFVSPAGAVNIDFVDGQANFRTAQANLFDETVKASDSETDITISWSATAGANWCPSPGFSVSPFVFVGGRPWWEWRHREGQQGTLDSDMKFEWGGGVQVQFDLLPHRSPFSAPAPSTPDTSAFATCP